MAPVLARQQQEPLGLALCLPPLTVDKLIRNLRNGHWPLCQAKPHHVLQDIHIAAVGDDHAIVGGVLEAELQPGHPLAAVALCRRK